MVVGQRADATVPDAANHHHHPESVRKEFVAQMGELHPPIGIDYFAIARNNFPWKLVPDFIVAHPAYDNFMLYLATSNNVSVVDATQTLTALHQTDTDGIGAGHRRADKLYNLRIIDDLQQDWKQNCWHIQCSEYRTRWLPEPVAASQNDSIRTNSKRILIERRNMRK